MGEEVAEHQSEGLICLSNINVLALSHFVQLSKKSTSWLSSFGLTGQYLTQTSGSLTWLKLVPLAQDLVILSNT